MVLRFQNFPVLLQQSLVTMKKYSKYSTWLFAIVLAALWGCHHDNSDNNSRSLPAIHAVILQDTFDFSGPTSHQDWDDFTDCVYAKNNLVVEVRVGLDGRPWSLPTGTYNGDGFIIHTGSATSEPIILFQATGQWFNIVWEMTP